MHWSHTQHAQLDVKSKIAFAMNRIKSACCEVTWHSNGQSGYISCSGYFDSVLWYVQTKPNYHAGTCNLHYWEIMTIYAGRNYTATNST